VWSVFAAAINSNSFRLSPSIRRWPNLSKKAAHWFAFFFAFLALLPLHAQSDTTGCPDLPISGQGQIKYVYDGDTVQLSDGRKVRLLGINTPEIDHQHGHSEPFAEAARRRLKSLAPRGTHVSLQTDDLQHDRYGRLLAHLQLTDGTNPALTLLEEGVATIFILPPNTAAATCFAAAQQRAINNAAGIWSHPRYRPVPAAGLTAATDLTGYQIISGRVTQVTASKRFHYLTLDNRLSARISKQDWNSYFNDPFATHWPGTTRPRLLLDKQILLRGWLQVNRKNSNRLLQVRLHHPAQLELQ